MNEKKSKKIYVFEALTYRYCQSQEIFFKHNLQVIYFGEILHGQIRLSGRLNKTKERLEIFLIDQYACGILLLCNKNTYMSPILYLYFLG